MVDNQAGDMRSDHVRRLAVECIVELLRKGLKVESDVLDFIESTFGVHSIEDIQSIINNDDDDTRDSLIELILFPEVTMQESLEEFLSHHKIGPEDETAILNCLRVEVPLITAVVPEMNHRLTIPLTPDNLAKLIVRLRIRWSPSPELSRAILSSIPIEECNRIRVKLRNLPVAYTPIRTEFLCRFLNTIQFREIDFEDCFDYTLHLLGELSENLEGRLVLQKKRKRLETQLVQAEKIEQELAKNNMETLMLRGVRPLSASAESLRREIALLDRIGNACCGPLCFAEPTQPRLHLETGSQKKDLEKIISFLS